MKKRVAWTMFVFLMPTLSGGFCPTMAQHRGGGGAGRGQMPHHPAPHPGNGGMPHVPAHIQQQIQQQQRLMQQQMIKQQQEMQKEFARRQQEAQKQYDAQVKQFHEHLKANGGASLQGKLSNFKTPEDFNRWAANQKKRKAQGKSYDALYDHYRSFADSMNPRGAGAHKGRGGKASLAESEKGRNEKSRREAEAARKKADQAKHEMARREENSKRKSAGGNRMLAQDQASVNLLRTVHHKLREADHDYQGHRVQALHHVNQAIEHLGSSVPMGLGSGMSHGNMPQAQSDGILRDSLHKLRTAESQLASGSNAAAHHARARTSLGQAIRELEVALRIR
jgi:hypothetical protein